MAEKKAEIAAREERSLRRSDPWGWAAGPFGMLQRFSDEMDRLFDEFGVGRGLPWRAGRRPTREPELTSWLPDVEVFHKNNEFIVRADLPGLRKEDVKIDVTDDAITIQGERKREHEEEREGFYRSERSYGSFYRVIPVPEGGMTDQAKATFKNGVLEITMPAPPEQVTRGRRLEISEGASAKP
jgi:HSP20 family protein